MYRLCRCRHLRPVYTCLWLLQTSRCNHRLLITYLLNLIDRLIQAQLHIFHLNDQILHLYLNTLLIYIFRLFLFRNDLVLICTQ